MRLPKVTITRTINDKEKNVFEQSFGDLPEKHMDEYKKIVGDANAHVSASADMAFKEYGSGAGAMVTVSLACNQDLESIEKAVDLAGQLARAYAKEHQLLAEKEFLAGRTSNKPSPY